MAETIFKLKNVEVVQMGYLWENYPHVKKMKGDEIWWNVYVDGEFHQAFYPFLNHNIGDAINQANILCFGLR